VRINPDGYEVTDEDGNPLTVSERNPRWTSTDAAFESVVDESAGQAERFSDKIRGLLGAPPDPCLPEKAGITEQLALTDSAAAHIYRDMAGTPFG
jgi:hypothetical protein